MLKITGTLSTALTGFIAVFAVLALTSCDLPPQRPYTHPPDVEMMQLLGDAAR